MPPISLYCKEIQLVHSKGDQSWVFIGRSDAKAETAILWPPHAKSWLIGKDSDAGREWGQEEKGTTEDEMAGGHHRLVGRESEWTPGVVDGQGGLACCESWGRKESDTTERLNWTELMNYFNLLLKRILLNSFLESFNNYAMVLKVFLFHCTLGSTEDFVFHICIIHKQKISYIFTLTCLLVRLDMFFILACNCFFFIEVKFIYSEMHRFFVSPTSCGLQDLSSPTRDHTWAPGSRSTES